MSRSLRDDLNNPNLFSLFQPGVYSYGNSGLGKSASGQLTLAVAPRNSAAQRSAGGEQRRDGDSPYGVDDGGHLIGARFGGAATDENLTAQDRNLNRQDFKHLEDEWERLLSAPSNKVFVHIEAYAADGEGRPSCYMGYYIVEHTDENGATNRSFQTISFLNESRQQIASFESANPDSNSCVGSAAEASPQTAAVSGKEDGHSNTAKKEDARMAERMNPTHYNNMINALRIFAKDSEETCRELISASQACTTVLGEEDIAAAKISAEAVGSASKLMELGREAVRIAKLMEEELQNAQDQERRVWSGDIEGGDD